MLTPRFNFNCSVDPAKYEIQDILGSIFKARYSEDARKIINLLQSDDSSNFDLAVMLLHSSYEGDKQELEKWAIRQLITSSMHPQYTCRLEGEFRHFTFYISGEFHTKYLLTQLYRDRIISKLSDRIFHFHFTVDHYADAHRLPPAILDNDIDNFIKIITGKPYAKESKSNNSR